LREQKTKTEEEITKIKAADAKTEEALRQSQIDKNYAAIAKVKSSINRSKSSTSASANYLYKTSTDKD